MSLTYCHGYECGEFWTLQPPGIWHHAQLNRYYVPRICIHSCWFCQYFIWTLQIYSDLLRAGRSGDRIPGRAIFSSPVQAGPGARPVSYTMGTVSFSGVKRWGRGVDHRHPSRAEVKERVELNLYFPSGSLWPVLGWTSPLPLCIQMHKLAYCYCLNLLGLEIRKII